MSRFILIQEDDYEKAYLEAINYLNSKYHDQPTRLKNIPTSDIVLPYDPSYQPPSQHAHRSTPIGKLVI